MRLAEQWTAIEQGLGHAESSANLGIKLLVELDEVYSEEF